MNRVNGFNIVGNGATEEYDRPSASQSGSRGYSEFDLDFSTLDSLDYSNFFPPSPPRPYATTAPSLAPLPISITPSQWFVPAPATVVAPTTRSTRSQQDKDTGWTPSTRAIPASAPTAGAKQRASPAEGTQAAILTEKRRKRRESHNAVERRRRDNINDRITELASLLPECLLEPSSSTPYDEPSPTGDSPSSGGNPRSLVSTSLLGTSPALILGGISSMNLNLSASQMAAAQQGKPNKGIILSKSVDYIKYLQQLVELHAGRNRELELVVEDLRGNGDGSNGAGAAGRRSVPMSVKGMGSTSSVGSTRQDFYGYADPIQPAQNTSLFRTFSPSPSPYSNSNSNGSASASFHPSSLPTTFGSLSQYVPERFTSAGVSGRFGGREQLDFDEEDEDDDDGFSGAYRAPKPHRIAPTKRKTKKEEDEDEYMDE